MIWAAPWALFGLVALPLVWWLHKRLRRPPVVDLPSLIFLADEADAHTLPRGRRIDAVLLLALMALLCLTLAAAGPRFVRRDARRVISVVVSGGAPAQVQGYAGRVAAVLASIRSELRGGDDLRVTWVPGQAEAEQGGRRPRDASLLAAARAGAASLRVVISDRSSAARTDDVRWVSVGDPALSNLALVACSVRSEAGDTQVFCTVAYYGAESATFRIRGTDIASAQIQTTRPLSLQPGAMLSHTFTFEIPTEGIQLQLLDAAGGVLADALAVDDQVLLWRVPPRIFIDASLPERLRQRIDTALEAVVGSSGVVRVQRADLATADLAFVRRGFAGPLGDTWTLVLEPLIEGEAAERAPAGQDPLGHDPLVRDLSSAGPEWVYAASAHLTGPDERVLLQRRAASPWPILLKSARRVRLAPDPLRGEPAPVDTPFWPLLIENFLRQAGLGGSAGAGFRATGLLHPESSRPGTARAGLEPAALRGLPSSIPAEARPLRPFLILGALLCMLLLWGAPRLGRRLGPRHSSAKTHTEAA